VYFLFNEFSNKIQRLIVIVSVEIHCYMIYIVISLCRAQKQDGY